MRDFSGLDIVADRGLEKAAGVMKDPTTIGGAVAQGAAYATPILGSALSVADGIKNLRNGQIWSGLGNIGLGVGTGLLDFLSFGTLGTTARGAALLARAGKAAKTVAGARNAARLARGAKSVVDASNATRATINGMRASAKASQMGIRAAKAQKALQGTWAGRRVLGTGRFFGGGIGLTPSRTVKGRMLERGFFGEGGLMSSGLNLALGPGNEEAVEMARIPVHGAAMTWGRAPVPTGTYLSTGRYIGY